MTRIKKLKIMITGEDIEKTEFLCIAVVNIKCYSHFGEHVKHRSSM
jgi:hypothetical protein